MRNVGTLITIYHISRTCGHCTDKGSNAREWNCWLQSVWCVAIWPRHLQQCWLPTIIYYRQTCTRGQPCGRHRSNSWPVPFLDYLWRRQPCGWHRSNGCPAPFIVNLTRRQPRGWHRSNSWPVPLVVNLWRRQPCGWHLSNSSPAPCIDIPCGIDWYFANSESFDILLYSWTISRLPKSRTPIDINQMPEKGKGNSGYIYSRDGYHKETAHGQDECQAGFV